MKKLLLPLLFPTLLFSQNFQAHYGTAHDEDAYGMAITSDQGYILCGSTTDAGNGTKDATLLKMNGGGALQWSKQYGGSGDETAIYVSTLAGGGYVFCGETFSADVAGDAFIARTDSAGNLLWWKNYGRTGYDIAYSVSQLSDGGYIAAGLVENGAMSFDAFLMRLNAAGDTLWTKVIGGPGIDHAVRVIPTSDNGFLFSGKMLSYGSGSCDVWLVKTDQNGDTLWTSQIGGAGWDEGMDVIEVANGYIVCGGTNSSGAGDYDFLLMKTDLSGNPAWAKTYGGNHVEASYSVKEVPSGGYIFAGYTETFGPGHSRGTDSANAWVIRTDVLGDTLWSMAYGGLLKEECFSVNNVPGGGFAICGYTGSFGDSLQAYIFETDNNGYSGCNERRSSPDVNTPALVTLHHSCSVGRGLTITTPPITTAPAGFAQHANCGGPLTIEEPAGEHLLLYPNPVSGLLTIESGTLFNSIVITDMSGRTVKVLATGNATFTFDISDLAPGSYIVRVQAGEKTVAEKLFIIR